MCRFRVKGRPSIHIFHRVQDVPASCECTLNLIINERHKCELSVGTSKIIKAEILAV